MPTHEAVTASMIVALGASNTAGYGVGRERAYPAVIERLLRARDIEASVCNAGIAGNTTGEMLARLDRAVPVGTRVVLFQPGSNDERLGLDPAVRERNIATIEEKLASRGVQVIRVARAFAVARALHLQPDGVHYTEAGHDLIGRLLVNQVLAALGR